MISSIITIVASSSASITVFLRVGISIWVSSRISMRVSVRISVRVTVRIFWIFIRFFARIMMRVSVWVTAWIIRLWIVTRLNIGSCSCWRCCRSCWSYRGCWLSDWTWTWFRVGCRYDCSCCAFRISWCCDIFLKGGKVLKCHAVVMFRLLFFYMVRMFAAMGMLFMWFLVRIMRSFVWVLFRMVWMRMAVGIIIWMGIIWWFAVVACRFTCRRRCDWSWGRTICGSRGSFRVLCWCWAISSSLGCRSIWCSWWWILCNRPSRCWSIIKIKSLG